MRQVPLAANAASPGSIAGARSGGTRLQPFPAVIGHEDKQLSVDGIAQRDPVIVVPERESVEKHALFGRGELPGPGRPILGVKNLRLPGVGGSRAHRPDPAAIRREDGAKVER